MYGVVIELIEVGLIAISKFHADITEAVVGGWPKVFLVGLLPGEMSQRLRRIAVGMRLHAAKILTFWQLLCRRTGVAFKRAQLFRWSSDLSAQQASFRVARLLQVVC